MSTQALSPLEQLEQQQPLSPIERLAAMGNQAPSTPTQTDDNLSPLERLEAMGQQQQPSGEDTNLVDKWVASPSTVPNARIRNLPNPAAGLTPGQALADGVKTGGELAAIPASTIGLGEAAPIIAHLSESLPTLDKAYKVLKTVSGIASGTGGTLYTLPHLKDVLKIIGGSGK